VLILTKSEALLERNAVLQSPQSIEELVKIFIHATKVRLLSAVKRVLRLTTKDGNWFLGHGSWTWKIMMEKRG